MLEVHYCHKEEEEKPRAKETHQKRKFGTISPLEETLTKKKTERAEEESGRRGARRHNKESNSAGPSPPPDERRGRS